LNWYPILEFASKNIMSSRKCLFHVHDQLEKLTPNIGFRLKAKTLNIVCLKMIILYKACHIHTPQRTLKTNWKSFTHSSTIVLLEIDRTSYVTVFMTDVCPRSSKLLNKINIPLQTIILIVEKKEWELQSFKLAIKIHYSH
jgi:hypothetical protein